MHVRATAACKRLPQGLTERLRRSGGAFRFFAGNLFSSASCCFRVAAHRGGMRAFTLFQNIYGYFSVCGAQAGESVLASFQMVRGCLRARCGKGGCGRVKHSKMCARCALRGCVEGCFGVGRMAHRRRRIRLTGVRRGREMFRRNRGATWAGWRLRVGDVAGATWAALKPRAVGAVLRAGASGGGGLPLWGETVRKTEGESGGIRGRQWGKGRNCLLRRRDGYGRL